MTNRAKFGRIYNCHVNKEVLKMFYDEQQAYNACSEEPSLIFQLIKLGYYDLVERLIDDNKVDVNVCDSVGNDVVTRLLKARQYDLVLKLLKKRNWNVNHQNDEGDTFGHILALDNSVNALQIVATLVKKKNYLPNIKNKKGETILDKAITNNYMSTVFKVLENKNFNSIDINLFKKLCDACLKNSGYGKYSKINNLQVIVDNLDKKELIPSMEILVDKIKDNMENITNEIMSNGFSILESIINSTIIEATI